jgi:hypothetical protein
MRTSNYILAADNYEAIDYIDQEIIKSIKADKINSVAYFATRFDLLHLTYLVDEFYDLLYKLNLTQLFESYHDATFSTGFIFHLADAEYRIQHRLNEDQTAQVSNHLMELTVLKTDLVGECLEKVTSQ